MTEKPKYYDIRSDFWKERFEMADDYDTYLNASEADKADRWRSIADRIPYLSPPQIERLAGIQRKMNVLVYSGVWCGDCVRQGPMLKRIAEACGGPVKLKLIDRDRDDALKDELRILGAMRVPVAVFLTEDFFEIGRYGDRTLTTYRAKSEREFGAACATGIVAPPSDEMAGELAEWVDVFERMLLMARLSPPLREIHGD